MPNPPPGLTAALDLLNEGLWPVAIYPPDATVGIDGKTPLTDPGKQPIGAGWAKKRPTEASLRAIWKRTPGAVVGLKLGVDGGAIDIEIDDPESGPGSLDTLFSGEEPETLGWSSRRGGHYLFLWDDRLTNYVLATRSAVLKDKKLPGLPGIEIRIGAVPGKPAQTQSVVPPSPTTEKVDGKVITLGPREWNGAKAIAPLPQAFFNTLDRIFAEPAPRVEATNGRPSRPVDGGRWTTETRAVAYLKACPPAIAGANGHGKTFGVACRVGPGFDLAPATALRLIRDHYNPTCQPPWSESELEHKVTDAYVNETRRGWLRDADRNGHSGNGKARGGVVEPPTPENPIVADGGPNRPRIVVDVDQFRVIDECEAALAAEENLYCRANGLVRILRSEGGRKKHDPERPPGTPLIVPVEEPTLSEVLSRHAEFVKRRKADDDHDVVKLLPPKWAVSGLRLRGIFPSVRSLEGIIETPTIRRDGSILDAPGWDEETGLLFLPGTTFGPIPDQPSRADAQAAAAVLLDLVCDVPFKDRRHSAAWLAALLTVIARHAVDGPTPLFIFDANLRSVGKSLLCDLLYAIAAGREMPRKTYPEDDAEMRKVITSIALAGDAVTMFDNLASGGMVGGRIIDNILTATTWKDRLLATNREPVLPWRSVLFATGNNLQIHADTFSRSVRSRIESDEMRPEERRDFKVKGCLIKHAMERRAELVRAALTILRGHALAGRPGDADLPRIRSNYRSWSDVIRCAVYWSTGIDPCEIQEDERGIDQDATAAEALTSGWLKLCRSEGKDAMTVSAALEAVERSGVEHAGLRELFMSWSRDNKLPSSKTVGRRLAQFSKRPTSIGTLQQTPPQNGIAAWYVKPTSMHAVSGLSGLSGFGSHPSRIQPDGSDDSRHTNHIGDDGKQTHQTLQTHLDREIEL